MKNQENKLLTPLELKVMNILWSLKKAFVKEIIQKWPDKPEPAYNTISTIVRILQDKEFVGHESQGRSHQYFPLVSKGKYQQRLLKNVMDNVFAGSLTGMVSSLLSQEKLSDKEVHEIKQLLADSDDQ
jgi:BlaI family penicillinase repressor